MTENITLRPAAPGDVDIIYSFVCELEESAYDGETFRNIYNTIQADPDKVLIVAVKAGEVVGFISCYFQPLLHHNGIVGEIQELFVTGNARQMGIGKLLIAEVLKNAQKRGALQMEVTTSLARNEAHEFYLKEGFTFSHKKFVRVIV